MGMRRVAFKDCRHRGHSACMTFVNALYPFIRVVDTHLLPGPRDDARPTEQMSALSRARRYPFLQAQSAHSSRSNVVRDLSKIKVRVFILFGRFKRSRLVRDSADDFRNGSIVNVSFGTSTRCWLFAFQ